MIATERVTEPRVTIVMTARERHSLTEAAIDSIVDETPAPYRFLYLDCGAPDWLRETLAERAGEWRLEVIRFDEPLWPHEARQRIAPTIDTDYAVFIDNDVQVEEGWLHALVACADETNAGIVGPLYLWGDDIRPPTIHMAGGKLIEGPGENGQRVLEEKHHLFNVDPRLIPHELQRRPCDFVEFHCMLIRTELIRDPAFFDPRIRCVHEHIDCALQAAQRGLPVYFEPASRIRYMAFTDYMLDDLSFFRDRWSVAEGEASIGAFAAKWNVVNDDRSFGGVREFLSNHLGFTDPLRPDRNSDLHLPMRNEELVHSLTSLVDLAARRGYEADDIARIGEAHALAGRLLEGRTRIDGRAFIEHLTGTASVLVRYDFAPRIVVTGLLHAAYTHGGPRDRPGEDGARTVSEALAGLGNDIERRVRAYTLRERDADLAANDPIEGDDVLETLSINEAEILAIEAANELELHLGGEFERTQRTDEIGPGTMRKIERVCEVLGVEGLAVALNQARAGETSSRPPADAPALLS